MDHVVSSLRHAVLHRMVDDAQFRQAFKAGQLHGQLDLYSVRQVAFAVSLIDAYQKHAKGYEKTLTKVKEFDKLNASYQEVLSRRTGLPISKETFMDYMYTSQYEEHLKNEDQARANYEIILQSQAMIAKNPDYQHWHNYFVHSYVPVN